MSLLEINSYTLGDLATNCYLIWSKKTRHATIIDPADEGGFLSEEIMRLDLSLDQILLTHGHFDHVLGLLELSLNFPNAPIFIEKNDLFLLKKTSQSAKHWLKRDVDPTPLPNIYFKTNENIKIAGEDFLVLPLPGHTPGSVGFYSPKLNWLFSGDTLFKQAVGRTDFAYSNHNELLASLELLAKLPSATKVFPGHGEPTDIEAEFK